MNYIYKPDPQYLDHDFKKQFIIFRFDTILVPFLLYLRNLTMTSKQVLVGLAIGLTIIGAMVGCMITHLLYQRHRQKIIWMAGLKPGTSLSRDAPRFLAYQFVEYTIQFQQKHYGAGEKTKLWFLKHIETVNINGKPLTMRDRLSVPPVASPAEELEFCQVGYKGDEQSHV